MLFRSVSQSRYAVYCVMMCSIALIWAFREVLVSDKPAKQAFWNGLKIARKKFWASLLLGVVNSILGGLLSSVPWIIFGVFAVGGYLAFLNNLVSLWTLGVGVPLFVAALVVSTVLGAIIEAFKAATWTVAYDKIKGKYDN